MRYARRMEERGLPFSMIRFARVADARGVSAEMHQTQFLLSHAEPDYPEQAQAEGNKGASLATFDRRSWKSCTAAVSLLWSGSCVQFRSRADCISGARRVASVEAGKSAMRYVARGTMRKSRPRRAFAEEFRWISCSKRRRISM